MSVKTGELRHKPITRHISRYLVAYLLLLPFLYLWRDSSASTESSEENAIIELAVLNESGLPSQFAMNGSLLTIQSRIINNANAESSLLYVVQIKDTDGRVISIAPIPIIMEGGETRAMETFWRAEGEGDHTIQVSVWQNVESPSAFSFSSTYLEVSSDSAPKIECSGSASCIHGIVTKVIDGDTIDVDYITVRLALVDTPERGEPGYQEAASFTSRICAEGSNVLVDEDDGQKSGSYGRMIAKVYCERRLINEELLESQNAIILIGHCDESEFGHEDWARKYGC